MILARTIINIISNFLFGHRLSLEGEPVINIPLLETGLTNITFIKGVPQKRVSFLSLGAYFLDPL